MKHSWLAALALGPLLALAPGCSCNLDGSDDDGTVRPLHGDPGRVTLRRLNRAEYDNTVRDLLGTALRPARDFPYDDTSFGFDNVADTLSISPLHVEMYEQAAVALATEATELPLEELYDVVVPAESPEVTATTGAAYGDYYNLWSNGELHAPIEVPVAGLYALTARLYADQGGPDLALASLGVDGQVLDTFDVVAATRDTAELHTVEVQLQPGPHTITVWFHNDYYDPGNGVDRNLKVDWVSALGPLDAEPGPNPIRDRLYTCDPQSIGDEACAQQILSNVATRAWRRPLAGAEVGGLLGLFQAVTADGGTFDDGVRVALSAVLLSPHFIYRVEVDPDPEGPEAVPLGDYELASRLSYFLWSSMPDEALFAAAEAGALQDDAEIERQVRRMLADPKAAALTEEFAGQWLYIRGIDNMVPDVWTYPDFDAELRASMKEEMERFFASFVGSDRPMSELLTATHGEIDARLAAHYGVTPPSTAWGAVDLTPAERGGVLGQAGLHLVTSYPTRTSPVQRGKWVLSQLLCSEPKPPPPGVEGLIEDDANPQTVRERLEQHRADPMCASCHDVMDPLGFAFEHFDGIGTWREVDHGFPVDAMGELPDGRAFYGTQELGQVLAEDPLFSQCVSRKLFTWALGRAPAPTDAPYLLEINGRFGDGDLRFSELAVAIATSPAFRMRRGEP